jgi:hypothetical protein
MQDVLEDLPTPDTIRDRIDRLRREARALRLTLTAAMLADELRASRRAEAPPAGGGRKRGAGNDE